VFENDGFSFPQKPLHFLKMEIEHEEQKRLRQRYDEYILNVDAEFARLYDHLYANGNLENTWLILTSDHGEMFERGIRAHGRPVFYEPIIKVPLLILPPKQTVRQDIYTPTSAIDLLPTLLHFAQKSAPETLTGQLLPPFNNAEPEESRSIYAVAAGQKDPLSALSRATIMLLKDNYKMIYYFGYENMPGSDPYYELFNLVADPDEMVNLAGTKPQLEKDMFSELVASLHQNDKFPASN
jgi:arylsulfatase A-like enzyme